MQTEFALFPGCVLQQAASEARTALDAIATKLGLTLRELPGWSCCGASHVQDADPTAALVANARNLALAEGMGLPLLTVCSTCLLMLRQAKRTLDANERGARERIGKALAAGGMRYQGTSPVTSLLWVLAERLDSLREAVCIPLSHMKVAGFYGCHSLRPERDLGFESSVAPHSLEDIVRALGAEPVPLGQRLACCGFHAIYPAREAATRLTDAVIAGAAEAGATCIVTPCPLCQMQLDMHQGTTGIKAATALPVLHLQQLVGLALGLTPDALGLGHNIVPAGRLRLV